MKETLHVYIQAQLFVSQTTVLWRQKQNTLYLKQQLSSSKAPVSPHRMWHLKPQQQQLHRHHCQYQFLHNSKNNKFVLPRVLVLKHPIVCDSRNRSSNNCIVIIIRISIFIIPKSIKNFNPRGPGGLLMAEIRDDSKWHIHKKKWVSTASFFLVMLESTHHPESDPK